MFLALGPDFVRDVMKYMGSKEKFKDELIPILTEGREEGQWYVEPFCGGCNIIDRISGNRIANDVHHYLIKLLKGLSEGWEPPHDVSEELYHGIKANPSLHNPALVGFVGFLMSYAGKWWGGYARGESRDYCLEARNNLLKQAPHLKGIKFYNEFYRDLIIPPASIIYCDPPYASTTKYKDKFDSPSFWNWVRGLCNKGHKVFVSEYAAPDDFKCIWQQTVVNSLTKDTGSSKAIERLWVKR